MAAHVQAAVAAAALVLVACSGSKGEPGPAGPSGASGATGVAGPSGPSGPAGSSAGRLRAYLNDGTDLGFVYAVVPVSVTYVQPGQTTLVFGTFNMFLVKQQPPGASPPVLVPRFPPSGQAQPCQPILFETADCTPTPGWPVCPASLAGSACVDDAGHARAAADAAVAQTVTYGSRLVAVWDGATSAVTGWTCLSGAGQQMNVFAGEDRGVLPPISGRIHYAPAD